MTLYIPWNWDMGQLKFSGLSRDFIPQCEERKGRESSFRTGCKHRRSAALSARMSGNAPCGDIPFGGREGGHHLRSAQESRSGTGSLNPPLTRELSGLAWAERDVPDDGRWHELSKHGLGEGLTIRARAQATYSGGYRTSPSNGGSTWAPRSHRPWRDGSVGTRPGQNWGMKKETIGDIQGFGKRGIAGQRI